MTIYELTAVELRTIARENNMPGAWKATKSQMIKFLESIDYSHVGEVEPESTKEGELDNLSAKNKSPSERKIEPFKRKPYAAWVVDRETKELTTVVDEAESREAFYQSIKDQYRVRLITKPNKLEEECIQWEIRHARNKKLKNAKYAADKEKAKEMKMNVAEYRKWVRDHE